MGRMKCPRAKRLSPAKPANGKNGLSNESGGGDDIRILAAGLRSAGHTAFDLRALRARVAAIATAPAARIRRRAPRLVSIGNRGDLARRRFAARRLRRSAVDSAYD